MASSLLSGDHQLLINKVYEAFRGCQPWELPRMEAARIGRELAGHELLLSDGDSDTIYELICRDGKSQQARKLAYLSLFLHMLPTEGKGTASNEDLTGPARKVSLFSALGRSMILESGQPGLGAFALQIASSRFGNCFEPVRESFLKTSQVRHQRTVERNTQTLLKLQKVAGKLEILVSLFQTFFLNFEKWIENASSSEKNENKKLNSSLGICVLSILLKVGACLLLRGPVVLERAATARSFHENATSYLDQSEHSLKDVLERAGLETRSLEPAGGAPVGFFALAGSAYLVIQKTEFFNMQEIEESMLTTLSFLEATWKDWNLQEPSPAENKASSACLLFDSFSPVPSQERLAQFLEFRKQEGDKHRALKEAHTLLLSFFPALVERIERLPPGEAALLFLNMQQMKTRLREEQRAGFFGEEQEPNTFSSFYQSFILPLLRMYLMSVRFIHKFPVLLNFLFLELGALRRGGEISLSGQSKKEEAEQHSICCFLSLSFLPVFRSKGPLVLLVMSPKAQRNFVSILVDILSRRGETKEARPSSNLLPFLSALVLKYLMPAELETAINQDVQSWTEALKKWFSVSLRSSASLGELALLESLKCAKKLLLISKKHEEKRFFFEFFEQKEVLHCSIPAKVEMVNISADLMRDRDISLCVLQFITYSVFIERLTYSSAQADLDCCGSSDVFLHRALQVLSRYTGTIHLLSGLVETFGDGMLAPSLVMLDFIAKFRLIGLDQTSTGNKVYCFLKASVRLHRFLKKTQTDRAELKLLKKETVSLAKLGVSLLPSVFKSLEESHFSERESLNLGIKVGNLACDSLQIFELRDDLETVQSFILKFALKSPSEGGRAGNRRVPWVASLASSFSYFLWPVGGEGGALEDQFEGVHEETDSRELPHLLKHSLRLQRDRKSPAEVILGKAEKTCSFIKQAARSDFGGREGGRQASHLLAQLSARAVRHLLLEVDWTPARRDQAREGREEDILASSVALLWDMATQGVVSSSLILSIHSLSMSPLGKVRHLEALGSTPPPQATLDLALMVGASESAFCMSFGVSLEVISVTPSLSLLRSGFSALVPLVLSPERAASLFGASSLVLLGHKRTKNKELADKLGLRLLRKAVDFLATLAEMDMHKVLAPSMRADLIFGEAWRRGMEKDCLELLRWIDPRCRSRFLCSALGAFQTPDLRVAKLVRVQKKEFAKLFDKLERSDSFDRYSRFSHSDTLRKILLVSLDACLARKDQLLLCDRLDSTFEALSWLYSICAPSRREVGGGEDPITEDFKASVRRSSYIHRLVAALSFSINEEYRRIKRGGCSAEDAARGEDSLARMVGKVMEIEKVLSGYERATIPVCVVSIATEL